MWFSTYQSSPSSKFTHTPVRDARAKIINVSLTIFKSVSWNVVFSISSFDVIFLNGMVFCILLYISSSVEHAEANLDAKVYYAMLGWDLKCYLSFAVFLNYLSQVHALSR